MTAAPEWLTDADRELIGAAYRGPWGPSHKTPDRLVDSVNLIVATHLQAQRERIARAIEDLHPDAAIPSPISFRDAMSRAARLAREATP